MQEADTIPHSWKALALYALTAILSGGAGWLVPLLRRKQSKADAGKTNEEARALELENDLRSGDAVVKLTVRVIKATERAERVQLERDHWQMKAEALEAEKNLLNVQLDKYISVSKRLAE